jgi:hypothetical protein
MIVNVALKDDAEVEWIRGGRYIFLSHRVRRHTSICDVDRAFINANMEIYHQL